MILACNFLVSIGPELPSLCILNACLYIGLLASRLMLLVFSTAFCDADLNTDADEPVDSGDARLFKTLSTAAKACSFCMDNLSLALTAPAGN